MRLLPLLPLLALLANCTGSGSGELANAAALETSEYLALDLATGAVTALPASTGGALDAWRLRADRLLFRRVPAGTYALADEDLVIDLDVLSRTCWVGVFEVTGAQWARLAGLPPTTDALPVTGLAPAEVDAGLAAFPLTTWRLHLPDDHMWVAAASDGNGKRFAWGDGAADLQTATYAVCLRSDNTTPGLQAVGSLPATGRGFCDLHGNAWELVEDGSGGGFAVRGGAWDSPALNCRTANRIAIDADLAHPLIGFRLVLTP